MALLPHKAQAEDRTGSKGSFWNGRICLVRIVALVLTGVEVWPFLKCLTVLPIMLPQLDPVWSLNSSVPGCLVLELPVMRKEEDSCTKDDYSCPVKKHFQLFLQPVSHISCTPSSQCRSYLGTGFSGSFRKHHKE